MRFIVLIKYLTVLFFIPMQGQEISFNNIAIKNSYLFKAEIEDKVERDTTAWKYQIAATDYATKGDYRAALEKWEIQFGAEEKTFSIEQIDSIRRKYRSVSAAEYIAEQSKSHQVIIINEAHHNSLHRVFTRSLLEKLFKKGYKNLGLEALGNGEYLDSLLNNRGSPIQKTGWYTKEPQFGNMIRSALEIGYHLFPYEAIGHKNGKEREIEQAKNIVDIIEARPDEKFLIHCGFGHVLEGVYDSWEKTMTGRLKEYTGIDPLTISQTAFSEKSNPTYNHPFLKAIDVKESAVLLDREDKPYRYEHKKSWADLVVFHPVTKYTSNRPEWLFNRNTKKVDIPLNEVMIDFPLMIQAFKKGEDISNVVAVDILEVEEKAEKAVLALDLGKYQIVLVNRKNNAVTFEIEVK